MAKSTPKKATARHAKPVRKKIVKPSSSKPSKSDQTAKAGKPAKAAPPPAGKAVPAATAARADLRSSILAKSRAKAAERPIAFSLDEVRAIAKTASKRRPTPAPAPVPKVAPKVEKAVEKLPPSKPHHIKAASLADILGFNPKKAQKSLFDETDSIPEKYRRYYKLLFQLRSHLTGQLDEHTEDTLKRSAKDDAGDLSSYGQHMADAGTDTFDRDFALSMVANEQEALSEIEAAIQRIKAGSYGICEVTAKPIAKDRLLAVPFTRYSAEAQKGIERNKHHARTQAGLFGELGEDGAKMEDDGGGDE